MKHFRILILFFFCFCFSSATAQFPPGVEWDRCIQQASVKSAITVSDNLFVVAYETQSCNDSSAIGISKYDGDGNLIWDKQYAPADSYSYHAFSLQKITDGFVLTGSRIKNDSSFNYILKTDFDGKLIWDQSFFCDTFYAPVRGKTIGLADGKLLFTGSIYTSHLSDVLIMKLNSDGNIIWQKTFGGSLFDYGRDVAVASNGKYIVASTAGSNDFDVSGNHGANDIWMLMLDTAGTVQWKKTFGGLYNDEARSVAISGNEIIVGGMSESDDADLTDHHGSITYFDFAAFKMDLNGVVLWKHSFGGMYDDFTSELTAIGDGNFLVSGSSYSLNGDVNDHHGEIIYNDQWTLKINSAGSVLWKKSTGGFSDDWSNCICALDSEKFILAGGSISKDGDHHDACFANTCRVISGGWMVKLNEHCPSYPGAVFNYSQNNLQFSFINQSYNATGYHWDFGDGNSSNEFEPEHTFAENGVYNVCLTAIDTCSSKTSCITVTTCPVPVSVFSYSYVGNEIQFNNLSVNAASYSWDFGDGNSSVEENPLHAYASNGSYVVKLTIIDSCNQQSSTTDTINTCDGFAGEFSYANAGNIFSFTDASIGLADLWSWDFGDGNFSSLQNPIHEFTSGGFFNVCLTVLSAGCLQQMVCKTIQVCEPVALNMFSYSGLANEVFFFDSSSLATSYYWNFGDGNFSFQQNPIHSYGSSGTYSVCEIASSACDEDTICSTVVFECIAVQSDFGFSINQYDVSFSDSSQNATSWIWNFGDGSFSDAQNPSHQYATSGNYNVCLIASNTCSTDTICISIHIECTPLNTLYDYNAAYLNVNFTSLANNASSWSWDFGDGNFSAEENPLHSYSLSGDYIVCLIAFNFCNSDTFCNAVHVICPPFTADFSFTQSNDTAFFNSTSPTASQWYWDFGDGNFSIEENPNHVYSNGATYYVCLVSGDGCSSDTLCDSVQVYGVATGTFGVSEFDINVFPDPASSFATLEFTLLQQTKIKVDLFSVEGKKEIEIADAIFSAGNHELNFKCAFLSAGIYFLQIKNDPDRSGEFVVKKFVKE